MFDKMPSWEEWNGLKEDQRQYSLYKVLDSMDNRLCDRNDRITKLENRKWTNRAASFAGGVFGGALAVLGLKELK